MTKTDKTNMAAAEHFFWFTEAGKRLSEMAASAVDLTTGGNDRFDKAETAFNEAITRSRKAYQDFQTFFFEQ